MGFQEAVTRLEAFRDTPNTRAPVREESPRRQPPPEFQCPSENPPFNGSYEKYYVPSQWLGEELVPQTGMLNGIYKGQCFLDLLRFRLFWPSLGLASKRIVQREGLRFGANEEDPRPEASYQFPNRRTVVMKPEV